MNLVNSNEIFLLVELVKKNFSSKYKDSVLGIFWTILSPLLMLVLFTIVFSTIFAGNIDNYQVYFLSGWCTFQFFNSAVNASLNSLRGNKGILMRTAAPKYVFTLASIISEFLNFIIMLILLFVIMIITRAPFYFTTIFSIIPIISLFIMITGLGLILAVACVYYTDVQHLWRVISMMLMYASAIFYPIEIVPEPFRHYLMLNPLFWIIDQLRCFIYKGIFPEFSNIFNSILFSLIILVLGIIVFKTYEYKVSMKF